MCRVDCLVEKTEIRTADSSHPDIGLWTLQLAGRICMTTNGSNLRPVGEGGEGALENFKQKETIFLDNPGDRGAKMQISASL